MTFRAFLLATKNEVDLIYPGAGHWLVNRTRPFWRTQTSSTPDGQSSELSTHLACLIFALAITAYSMYMHRLCVFDGVRISTVQSE